MLLEYPLVASRNFKMIFFNRGRNFFKKQCGRPQHKKKDEKGSVYLMRELFSFQRGEDGVKKLFVGNKKHNIGFLSIKNHRSYKTPNSIYIKKKQDQYWVSFCYEAPNIKSDLPTEKQQVKKLSKFSKEYLLPHVVGVDRGVARAVQTSLGEKDYYDLNFLENRNKTYLEKRRLYYQKEAIPTEKRKQKAV